MDYRQYDTRYVSAPEAAVILDCSARAVRKLAETGALPGRRDPVGWWQFRLLDVLDYKRAQRRTTAARKA